MDEDDSAYMLSEADIDRLVAIARDRFVGMYGDADIEYADVAVDGPQTSDQRGYVFSASWRGIVREIVVELDALYPAEPDYNGWED